MLQQLDNEFKWRRTITVSKPTIIVLLINLLARILYYRG